MVDKIDERPPPASTHVVRITSQQAATGQLQTALWLWFHEQDLASTHRLAIAAQGLFNAMCKEKGIQGSQMNAAAERHPRGFRDFIRSPQNFFKHGRHKQKHEGIVSHAPELTELVLLDCLSMHQRLFDQVTPLMTAFAIRHSLFNPNVFKIKIETKGIKIEDLARLGRTDFLKEVLPRLGGMTPSA
jgi:hypothetical protein